jgi:pimeloyl-ACP methyl ester carboxylesterase
VLFSFNLLSEFKRAIDVALKSYKQPATLRIYKDLPDLIVSASSKARSGPEVLPRCQATNKSQVAPVSAMGTMTTFGILRWEIKHVAIPVAVSAFPDELYQAPRSWTERAYPKLIYYNKLDKGGHFAAWEQPELLSQELRAAFKSLRGEGGVAIIGGSLMVQHYLEDVAQRDHLRLFSTRTYLRLPAA